MWENVSLTKEWVSAFVARKAVPHTLMLLYNCEVLARKVSTLCHSMDN